MKQIFETGFKLLQLIMALYEGHSMMLGSIALLGLANMVYSAYITGKENGLMLEILTSSM